jgi:serine/threonine protein kinase/Tol biopolymer transport system component
MNAGTTLGAYEIIAKLGAGGMGEVYKARDTRLDRFVAIKILSGSLAVDPQFRERFDREARTISQLTHPHICTLYDVGQQAETAFLVMEYLEGETLESRLKKGALGLDHALKLAIEIADALRAAHRRGIVHRDLKPGNVMLTKSGAKLLDFGLAKTSTAGAVAANVSMLPTTPPNLTAHGTILGTLQYMAPEQLEGHDADARTDLFAFGALVYEMVTGRKAFEAKTQASLIAAILTQEPAPISAVQPITPPALSRVVKKCLSKDPEGRYDSAHDVRDELVWISEGDVERSLPQKRRVGLWLASVAAVMFLIGAIAAATLYVRRPSAPLLVTQLDVVTPATSDPSSFALSGDGRQLVFVAKGQGLPQLWIRSFDQPAARPLAGTDGASYPFWAPDGQALGFFADGQVKRVEVVSGSVQVLATAAVPRGGTWSRDDVILFGAGTPGLTQVGANGGTTMSRTRTTGNEADHRWPQFLPDGRHFLFYAFGTPPGIFVGSLDGGEPVRLGRPQRADSVGAAGYYAAPGYLLTVFQGALVARSFDPVRLTLGENPQPIAQSVGVNVFRRGAVSASDAGVLAYRGGTATSGRQLEWMDRTGKTLGVLLPPEDTNLGRPELSPDGRSVAVTRIVQANPDIWLIDTARGIASRFTFERGVERAPIWSPDGLRIVFGSNAKGRNDLLEKPVNGSAGEQPLVVSDEDKMPMDWSADGKYLLYTSQSPNTQSDLWVMPMVGDRKPFPLVRTAFDDVHGQFSPDGRFVAYASNDTGGYEVYVRSVTDQGGKWQISNTGGIYPRWSRDGRELFFVARDNQMMAASIAVESAGNALSPGVPVALFPTRIVTGGNTGIGGFASKAEYAVTRGGRFLMNVTPEESRDLAPITIVQNWTGLLKK